MFISLAKMTSESPYLRAFQSITFQILDIFHEIYYISLPVPQNDLKLIEISQIKYFFCRYIRNCLISLLCLYRKIEETDFLDFINSVQYLDIFNSRIVNR